jgi:proteasome-associated ATPase
LLKKSILEVLYRSGRREFLHRGDLASGAIIAAIVERAKSYAILRSIADGRESPLGLEDLRRAFETEYRENDLFPPSDITEDWLKLTDLETSNVIRLAPYREKSTGEAVASAIV